MGIRRLPGAVHDLAAARIWGIVRDLATSGLMVLADKGYAGPASASGHPTRAGTSPPPRRTPTGLMLGYALPADAPTLGSRPGTSCASSAAALESRAAGQSHPRSPDPRNQRMKRFIANFHTALSTATTAQLPLVEAISINAPLAGPRSPKACTASLARLLIYEGIHDDCEDVLDGPGPAECINDRAASAGISDQGNGRAPYAAGWVPDFA